MVAYSFRHRFVDSISLGLRKEPTPGKRAKRQTIRAFGMRAHAKPGQILQLYFGMRSKQCKLIGVARCTSVREVSIKVGFDRIHEIKVAGQPLPSDQMLNLARRDGFHDLADMWRFWKNDNGVGVFTGVLIEWEPIDDPAVKKRRAPMADRQPTV